MAKRGRHRHLIPAVFHYPHRNAIGLLGGSFNPAHAGHLALSKQARLYGKFDQIWWLVSPQNPLKSTQDMAQFEDRLAYARDIAADHSWLRVLALESQSGSNYSYETVRFLQRRSPRARFTWLMGSDNLIQLSHWYRAKDLAQLLPFMVMRRQASYYASLASKGRYYFKYHDRARHSPQLRIIHHFHHLSSATALRQSGFWHAKTAPRP